MSRVFTLGLAAVLAGACSAPVPPPSIEATGTPIGSASGQPAATPAASPASLQSPGSTATPAPTSAEHRLAIRDGADGAEFFDRTSGQSFVPRGANYVYVPLAEGQVTVELLKVDLYDPERTRADFGRMAAAGYNTVRVFLDHCSDGPGCITSETGIGLNPRYLDNVADLMGAARETGLVVLFTSNDLPDGGGYGAEANGGASAAFGGYRNSYYLTTPALSATKRYWTDLLTGLRERHAAFDAVLGWELVNEQWMFEDQPPLSLNSGLVTSTTGTYDMSDPSAKAMLVSEGLTHYIAEVRAAILAVDPTALVTMGFFVPEIAAPDWYVDTAPLLRDSDLDFFDFHAYPGGASVSRHAQLFGMEGYSAKPIVMGEYGAFRQQYPDITSGARALTNWVADSCAEGWDGWLYWAFYPSDPTSGDQTWGLTDQDGLLMSLLSPSTQADPCTPVVVPSANLALGQPTKASRTLNGQPPSLAFDDNDASLWNAGDGPVQWIQVDLGGAHHIGRIRLVVAQDPAGSTIHRVQVRGSGETGWRTVHVFNGPTVDGQELIFEPASDLADVRYVRIETTASPSWIAWKEIQVFGD